MNCPVIYEWELFFDSELPPERIEEMQAHLAECGDCSDTVRKLRQEYEMIGQALAFYPLPANLEEFIKSRLYSTNRVNNRWTWLMMPAACLTGIFIASAVGIWSLLSGLLEFVKMLGGINLLPELALFLAEIARDVADSSIRGNSAAPALAVISLLVIWIKLSLRKGGHAHV
ncbi:MAG: anti-sigma factor family protein [Bacillota bacterium]